MTKKERKAVLDYIFALEDFPRPIGRFYDGQASLTPTREGVMAFGVGIDNSTEKGRQAIALYDHRIGDLNAKRIAAEKAFRIRRLTSRVDA